MIFNKISLIFIEILIYTNNCTPRCHSIIPKYPFLAISYGNGWYNFYYIKIENICINHPYLKIFYIIGDKEFENL